MNETIHGKTYAEIVAPYAAAIRMIRDSIEDLFGPVANLESEEAELLRGPEPHHSAEAQIAALQNVAARLADVARAVQAERERCAAFAYAKHDWPPRWIASSLRGENDGYRDFCETYEP